MDDEALLLSVEQNAPLFAQSSPSSLPPLHSSLSLLLSRASEPEGRESLGRSLAVERLASLLPKLSHHSPLLRHTLRGYEDKVSLSSSPLSSISSLSPIPLSPLSSAPSPLPSSDLSSSPSPDASVSVSSPSLSSSSSPSSSASLALQPLLFLLRILRNLCANSPSNQNSLRLCGLHDALAAMADALITSHAHLSSSLPKKQEGETLLSTTVLSHLENLNISSSPLSTGSPSPPPLPPTLTSSTSASPPPPLSSSLASSSPSSASPSSSSSSPSSGAPVLKASRSSIFARRSLSSVKLSGSAPTLSLSSPNPGGANFSSANPGPLSPFATPQSPLALSPHPSSSTAVSASSSSSLPSSSLSTTLTSSSSSSSSQLPILPSSVSPPKYVVEILRTILQLLGNFCNGNLVNQSAFWERCFPGTLIRLAVVKKIEIQEPLCMLIYTCCRGDESKSRDLTNKTEGIFLFSTLLSAPKSYGGGAGGEGGEGERDEAENKTPVDSQKSENVWLEFLVEYLCVRNGYLSTLFPRLAEGLSPTFYQQKTNDGLVFSSEQATFLSCLLSSLSHQKWEKTGPPKGQPDERLKEGEEKGREGNKEDESKEGEKGEEEVTSIVEPWSQALQEETLSYLLKVSVQAAIEVGKKLSENSEAGTAGYILRYSLEIIRDLCIKLNSGSSLSSSESGKSCLKSVVLFVLDLLQSLPPPTGSGSSSEKSVVGEEVALGSYPKTSFYYGYRKDLVAILANASYRQTTVQDYIRENGALMLVLQQCVVDELNPFLREWGFFAVRNLLEGNEANQMELNELEVKGGAEMPELKGLGLKVEVDSQTGRPKLVNIEG